MKSPRILESSAALLFFTAVNNIIIKCVTIVAGSRGLYSHDDIPFWLLIKIIIWVNWFIFFFCFGQNASDSVWSISYRIWNETHFVQAQMLWTCEFEHFDKMLNDWISNIPAVTGSHCAMYLVFNKPITKHGMEFSSD